ncbi:MAG TPA: hypothetical protein VMQ51_15140 [Candidatus Binatia bacterium]|nr:hypothetical protein [Candidatus Binatia bacterium]
MGVGGKQPQGLWITTRKVVYDPATSHLTRISEVGVILKFGKTTHAQAAPIIRQVGLKIGMLFPSGYQVGAPGNPNRSIEFTAAPTGKAIGALNWIVLPEAPLVTALLAPVFTGSGIGYRIDGAQIPDNPGNPPSWGNAKDRLYFRIVVRNFTPVHPMDVQVVPMVCTLDLFPDFLQHYVLGVGALTVGHDANGLEFDSEVIMREKGLKGDLATASAARRAAKPSRTPARSNRRAVSSRSGRRR